MKKSVQERLKSPRSYKPVDFPFMRKLQKLRNFMKKLLLSKIQVSDSSFLVYNKTGEELFSY
jgi:hypothetical protein